MAYLWAVSSARVERRTDCWSWVRPRTAAAVSSTDTTVLREPPPLDGASARRPPCVVDPRTSGLRGSRKIAAVEMLYRGRRRPRRGLQQHRRLHHGLRYCGSGRRQRHQPLLSLWYTRGCSVQCLHFLTGQEAAAAGEVPWRRTVGSNSKRPAKNENSKNSWNWRFILVPVTIWQILNMLCIKQLETEATWICRN